MFNGSKRIFVLLVLLVGVFFTSGLVPNIEAANSTTLRVWTNLTVPAQVEVLKEQLNSIIKDIPEDVKYEIEIIPFSDMYVRLITALTDHTLPDLMHTNEGPPAFLYPKNGIVPVDDIINSLGRKDFVQSYLHIVTKNKKTWAVPDWALHQSVWYRKDVFKEKNLDVPKSWGELLSVSEKLTEGGSYGFAVPMHRVQVAPQTYFQILYSAGVYIFDPKTGNYVFGKQKKAAQKALDFMVELYKKASPPSSVNWSWGEFRTALVKGAVAQTNEWGAVVSIAAEENRDMLKNLSLYPFPGPDPNKPPKASLGGGYYFLVGNTTKKEIKITKEILKKLYDPKYVANRALSRPIFALPATHSAFEIYRKSTQVKGFEKEIETIFEKVMPNWYRYGQEAGMNPLGSQIEATTFIGDAIQSVALGKWNSEKAVNYIDENLRALINKR